MDQLREASLGAQRIGHGFDTEVDEAIGALVVCPIEPVEGCAVFSEAQVYHGKVQRRNVARLSKMLQVSERLACADGISRNCKSVSVQSNHGRMIARKFAPLGKRVQRLAIHLFLAIG